MIACPEVVFERHPKWKNHGNSSVNEVESCYNINSTLFTDVSIAIYTQHMRY